MRMATTLLALMLGTASALASPPVVGTTADIFDPVFGNSVLCDTADEIKAVAFAKDPQAQFAELNSVLNAVGEPVCAAVVIDKGTVTSVDSIGTVHFKDHAFNGWTVGIHTGTYDVVALYLELIKEINS